MLRLALRRLLWIVPTLIGISGLTFLFLSYIPDPTADPAFIQALAPDDLTRMRRERFLDLPRFVNLAPVGVEERAAQAMSLVADDTALSEGARRELARLGGAALPYVLPRLDALAPERRVRVALALAPIAQRMGVASDGDAADPSRTVAFWSRLWDERGIEFRRATVRGAVSRVARYGSTSRATELFELDTFALDDVLTALAPPTDSASLLRARALTEIAAHVTGRDDPIAPGDDLAAARACVDRWKAFWSVYRSDFVSFSTGGARLRAMLFETRYGKWALGAVNDGLGRRADGGAVIEELAPRAGITLIIVFGALALAYAVAVPLGVVAAVRRGRRVDLGIACAVLGVYAVPTAVLAVLARGLFGIEGHKLSAAVITLALSLVAAAAAQQRSAVATVIAKDHVTAAIARGAGRVRAVIVHALRNALLPVVTLAALEGPMALGGAFVVERVFGLPGLGEATIEAVQQRDTAWLMALSISAAALSGLFVLFTDVAYTLIDHRLEPLILTDKGLG